MVDVISKPLVFQWKMAPTASAPLGMDRHEVGNRAFLVRD